MIGEYAALAAMVAVLRYKTGWRFRLDYGATSAANTCFSGGGPNPAGSTAGPVTAGWGWPVTLVICVRAEDTTEPGRWLNLEHRFAVPEGWDEPSRRMPWHRWLLDCVHRVEVHEMCEAFDVGGQRPFYPEHGPGAALYAITDRGLG